MDEDELDFITDNTLRKTIKDSIEYVYILSEESKKEDKSILYKEETYRVIILYIVSIIEAILLHLYKKHSEKITYIDYKFINQLTKGYGHTSDRESRVIVAVQKIIEKSEYQIGIFELVSFFRDKKVMKKETAEEILSINNLRNTLHLNKPRNEAVCDITQVESALKLLVHVIERVPKNIPKHRQS